MKSARVFFVLLAVLSLLSQSLPQTVRAEEAQDRILTIRKCSSEEDGSCPLASITFDLYHTQTGTLTARLTTDDQGLVSYNFTEEGQPDGVYLLVEQHNPATVSPRDPVYINIPGKNPDGSVCYHQTVTSHNVAEKAPDIRADVTELDCNSGSFPVGQPQTWILRCDIPPGISQARKYVVTDVLDDRLRCQRGSVRVTLAVDAGEEQLLEQGRDYILEEQETVLKITLTQLGMDLAAREGTKKKELRVRFDTVIHTNTAMGATIPNDAMLEYVSSLGLSYKAESDIPEVHTGGINILKTDAQGIPQAGVVFRLAKETEGFGQIIKADGRKRNVRFERFYTARDLSGTPQDTVTTGTDGRAALYGLAYGAYYLVEEGHEGQQIFINETSHLTASEGWEDMEGNLVDRTLYLQESTPFFQKDRGIGAVFISLAGILTTGGAWLFRNEKRKPFDF